MRSSTVNQNDPRLESLAREIHTFEDPWLFPQEHPVSGFFGMGPVMIIGDQPSTSPWSKANPGRRLFYGTLLQLGLEDSHITDVYKNRGKSGELERYVPADLQEHIEILKREIDIVRPKQIAALGRRAETLLHRHLPDLSPKAIYIQHFS
jgi:uracil-DNA glycosylase